MFSITNVSPYKLWYRTFSYWILWRYLSLVASWVMYFYCQNTYGQINEKHFKTTFLGNLYLLMSWTVWTYCRNVAHEWGDTMHTTVGYRGSEVIVKKSILWVNWKYPYWCPMTSNTCSFPNISSCAALEFDCKRSF